MTGPSPDPERVETVAEWLYLREGGFVAWMEEFEHIRERYREAAGDLVHKLDLLAAGWNRPTTVVRRGN